MLRAAETGLAGADDRQILDKAIAENRILVTLDGPAGVSVQKPTVMI